MSGPQLSRLGRLTSIKPPALPGDWLLDSGFSPTAVVCANDFMALGVLALLRERGLRVPQDVSLVGYDNIHLSEFTSPPLTTVNVPRDRIGHAICAALLPERGTASVREVVIEPELIVRDSTGPVTRTSVAGRPPGSAGEAGTV